MKKIILALMLLPALSFAADGFGDFLTNLGGWVTTIGQIIFAAVVVAFFWGLFMFVFSDEKKDDGKSMMLWGLVAIFVMASLWGIVGFLQESTGTTTGTKADVTDIIPSITP